MKNLLLPIIAFYLLNCSIAKADFKANTNYVNSLIDKICSPDGYVAVEKDRVDTCQSYGHAYELSGVVPSSNKREDLIFFESGFVANICKTNVIIGNCYPRAFENSQFLEIKNIEQICQKAFHMEVCYGEELMKLHNGLAPKKGGSCEQKLFETQEALRKATALLNEFEDKNDKVFSGSQKSSINKVIKSLSDTLNVTTNAAMKATK